MFKFQTVKKVSVNLGLFIFSVLIAVGLYYVSFNREAIFKAITTDASSITVEDLIEAIRVTLASIFVFGIISLIRSIFKKTAI